MQMTKRLRESKAQRLVRMQEMRLKGRSFERIAEEVGLSRQRVYELLRPSAGVYRLVRERAEGKCQVCGFAIDDPNKGHQYGNVFSPEGDYTKVESLLYLCDEHYGERVRKALDGGRK